MSYYKNFRLGFLSLVLISLFTSNPLLTAYSLTLVPVLFYLVWRPNEPPIFIFLCLYHWIQASIKIFHADFLGMTLKEFQMRPTFGKFRYADVETASHLSLTGILILALGIFVVLETIQKINKKQLQVEVSTFRINSLLIIYSIVFVFSFFIDLIAFDIPSITQILFSLSLIKWSVVFAITLFISISGKHQLYLLLIIPLEIINGFMGFFANFKDIFFYLIVSILTIQYTFKLRTILIIFIFALILFFLAVFWTGIKGDYRLFVNEGAATQSVNVSIEERYNKILFLSNKFTESYFYLSLEALLKRISYVDFFGATINYVPQKVPFQNGTVWEAAIANLLPRIFFPNKPELQSDSEHTMKFTGVKVRSGDKGVSFSIGYMGDSYIDYGPIFMFVPIFLLGLLWGFIYKFFIEWSRYKIIGLSFAVIVLMQAYRLEIASVKLLGWVLMRFFVYVFLLIYFEKRLFSILNMKF